MSATKQSSIGELLHEGGRRPTFPAPREAVITDTTRYKKHTDHIYHVANVNREYYQQQAADAKNGGRPWFRYVKSEYQYAEFVMITPAMARTMLEHLWNREEGNRGHKAKLSAAYQRDILNDNWIPSNEGIAIDLNGDVFDGQHRLNAIVNSNKQYPMWVIWNVLNEAKLVVDSGAKRNVSEKLNLIIDARLGNRTAGLCKAMMRGLGTRQRFTESEIAQFAKKWQHVINWIAENLPAARSEVQAAIAKAYIKYGDEIMGPFCTRLRTITFSDDGDPARSLFRALQTAKTARSNQVLVAYKKTLSTIDYAIAKKPLLKVFESEVDLFAWDEGWEYPGVSPVKIPT